MAKWFWIRDESEDEILAKQRGLKNVIGFADVNNIGSNKILMYTGFKKIKQVQLWGLELNYFEMEL